MCMSDTLKTVKGNQDLISAIFMDWKTQYC